MVLDVTSSDSRFGSVLGDVFLFWLVSRRAVAIGSTLFQVPPTPNHEPPCRMRPQLHLSNLRTTTTLKYNDEKHFHSDQTVEIGAICRSIQSSEPGEQC